MKKQISIATLGIIMIASVMAVTLFAGESYSFESEEFEYWDVAGNSSNMDGINISWENGNTTISFDKYYKSDSFTLIFFNEDQEVIYRYRSSGGGGGGTTLIYKDRNVTIDVPRYINNTETIEVDKVIDKIVYQETGYKLWHILLISFGVIIFIWFISRIFIIEEEIGEEGTDVEDLIENGDEKI